VDIPVIIVVSGKRKCITFITNISDVTDLKARIRDKQQEERYKQKGEYTADEEA
jgi:hypothetical protein